LASYNLHPKKRLGQHFLVDQGVLNRLIICAELKRDDVVLEIGGGLGLLTAELASRASRVVSVEKDRDLVQIARDVLKSCANAKVVTGDFLEFKSEENFSKVVGNLPYYITTPIIEYLLAEPRIYSQVPPKLIVLTIQREVAERMAAEPGSKVYGSFTVFVQNLAEVEIRSFVPKTAFYPQPEVGSAIITLRPRLRPLRHIDSRLVRAAFGQRRKMLRSALKELNVDFASAGIDPTRRAETLSLEEFERLSYNLKE
jgi:16S rRNA (adenine1518-N6/adenine1519-N6)-dimethyltransferase